MMKALLELSVLILAGSQDGVPVPWKTEVKSARESAVREGRACVILLHVDSL